MEENKNKLPGFWDKYGLLALFGVLKMPFAGFVLVMIVFYAIHNPIFGPDPIDDSGVVAYRDTTFSVFNDSTEILFLLSTKEKVTLERNNVTFLGSEWYKNVISRTILEAYEYTSRCTKNIPNIYRLIDACPYLQKLSNDKVSLSIFIGPKSHVTEKSIRIAGSHVSQYMVAKFACKNNNQKKYYEVAEIYNLKYKMHMRVPFNTINKYWIE